MLATSSYWTKAYAERPGIIAERLSVRFDGNASGSRGVTPFQVEENFSTKTRLYIGSDSDSEAQVSVVTHLTSNVSSTSQQLGDLRQSVSHV